jgi:hypothetical protein
MLLRRGVAAQIRHLQVVGVPDEQCVNIGRSFVKAAQCCARPTASQAPTITSAVQVRLTDGAFDSGS